MSKLFRKRIFYPIIGAVAFVFSLAMFFINSPKAEAASTSVIDSLTIKNIYDNRTTGKYGNFSWTPEILKESTDSYFVINPNKDPFVVKYTPTSGSIPEKYTFSIDAGEENYTANIAVARSENGLSFNYGGAGTRNLSNKTVPSSTKETDPIYFGISKGYMHTDIKISSFTLNLMVTKVGVKVAAGTGVKSVFLSDSSVATSGSVSGTNFFKGQTVYAYAVLKEGYKAQNSWTLIDGTANSENSIYRVAEKKLESTDFDFGTINATLKTRDITLDKNGGGNSTAQQLTYGQSATLSPISRNGYSFLGWNSKQDGTGTAYGDENGATLTVEQVNEMVSASSNTTLYAQWSPNTYTIIFDTNGGTINSGEVTEYVVGEGVILPTDVTKDNLAFVGWFDNDEFTGSPVTEILGTDTGNKEYFACFAAAENDGEYFETFDDAIDKAREGDVIKLLIDLNLSDSLTILKSITIDLNGHVLNIPYISSQTYTVWVSDNSIVTIDDSSSDVGGVKGTFGVQSGSYIALKHGRFDISKENILAKTNLYKVADNILLLNCNDGNPDEDGFLTLARPITDDDYANEVIDLINEINEVSYPNSKDSIDAARKAYDGLTEDQRALVSNYNILQTAESKYATLENEYYANEVIDLINEINEVSYPNSKESIDEAREAYDGLTEEQKALVSNYATLESAENNYATLEASNFEDLVAALPNASNLSLSDKDTVLAVEAVYDNLDEAPKALIKDTTVTRLNEIVAKINELINCNHNLIKFEINEVVKTSGPRTSSSINYKNNGILPGSIGIDIGFIGASNARCATGYAIVTATVNLEAARTIHFHWNASVYPEYANIILRITPNNEETRVYNNSGGWHIEEINCHAGLNTITFRYEVNKGSKNWADPGGRHLYILPEVISHFDENSKCDVCGVVCTHETIGMGYDETKGEYFFRCFDLCAHKVDLNELSHENKSIVESARAAYDKLTDEQKAKVPAAVLESLLQAEEDYKTYVYGENWTAASNVISMINNLPDVSSFTLDSKDDVLDARTAYNALTSEQKDLIENEDELLTKLTTLESKIPVLEVEALINALPAVDAITYDSEDAIKAARTAYNALPATQKADVSAEALAKLTNSETKFSRLFVDDVIALINALPAKDEITADAKDAIDAARTAYNALTAAQKAEISEEILAKLTDAENKYNSLFADDVIALIEALPDVNDLVFGDKSKIEQARAAYNSLTADQRKLITSEYTTKLSSLETKLREISWVDYSLPNGTYKFVSATDETKALIHIDNRTVRVGVYDDNNRHYKWKTVSWTDSPLHEIYNIFDPYAKERLLDSNGWGLSEGIGIGFVSVDYEKSEDETNLFRFSKHMGVIMEEDEYYIRIVDGTAYDFVLTLRSDTKVNIGAYSKGSLNQVWKVVRVKGDEDYAAEVEEKIKLLPESYDATTLDDEEIVNDAMEAYNNLTKYQKTLVSQERTKQLEDANQKIVDIKAANAFIQKMNAIGTVTYDKETLDKIHAARSAYNELTDAQKLIAGVIKTLLDAETAYAAYANAAINELLDTVGEITLEDKDNILAAKAKYDELSAEEKLLIEKDTLDKLDAALVSYHILLLPQVGVLVLSDKTQVVTVREEYEALSNEGKQFVSNDILNVLVSAETEIADIEAAKAVDDLINALPNLADLTINHATAVSAARTAYDGLTPYQQGKVTKACLDKLIVAEAIISALKLPKFADLTLDDEDEVNAVNDIIADLSNDQKALVPQAILDILASLNTKIADMKVAKGIDDLIDGIGEVEYTDTSKALIDNARLKYNPITDIQKSYVKHLDTLVNGEAAYAGFAAEEISTLLDLKVEDITISDKEAVLKAKAIYDSLTPEEKIHLSDELIDKILASSVTLAVIDIHETNEITLADDKDKILVAKGLYDELTEAQQQTLLPEKIVNKYFASLAILEILELKDTASITISDKEAVETARAKYDDLSDAQEALVPQTAKDKLIASEAIIEILLLPELDALTLENKTAVEAARTSFNDLSDDQEALVPQTAKDKLIGSEAVIEILLLPELDALTLENKTTVEAARTKYDALTSDQKAFVSQSVLDKLVASEASLVILGLPELASITATDKTAIEAARTSFNDLSDAQEVLVPQAILDKLIASEVTLAITLLKEISEIDSSVSEDDVNAIKTAKTKYDALTANQLALLPETAVDKILALSITINIIALPNIEDITVNDATKVNTIKEAYDALTANQKDMLDSDLVDILFAADAIVEILGLDATDKITSEDETAIKNAITLYNALSTDQEALVPQTVKDKLFASETVLGIVLLPEPDKIATTDKTSVEAARTSFNDLSDVQETLVPQAVLDKLYALEAILSILELPEVDKTTASDETAINAARTKYDDLSDDQEALVPQTAKDKLFASEATLLIAELPACEDIDADDASDILTARTKYDDLSDDQEALVPQTANDKLIASEATLAITLLKDVSEISENVSEDDINAIKTARTKYDALTENQLALLPQNIISKILTLSTTIDTIALPDIENISLDDADDIKALKEKYDSLTDEEKSMLDSNFVDKIFAADTTIEILELSDTEDITSDSEEDIKAAREAYDNLSDDQKALVQQDTVDKLVASEAVLDIVELPAGADIEATDKEAIEAARDAYDDLSDDQKALVPQTAKDKLIASEAVLDIVELPVGADIEATDKEAIEAARDAYDDLSPEQKALVPQATLDILVAAEAILDIVELPVGADIEATDKEAIEAAREAYDALDDAQKDKVDPTTVDTLVAAETTLTIVELPATTEITPSSRSAIEAAREAYDDLSDEQKAKVAKSTLDKLEAAETTLTISELPDTTEITADSEDDIKAAREAYDDLSDDQKALVPQATLDTLLAAEATLGIVELPTTTEITADSEDAIKAAREAYDDLTPEQKDKVTKETLDTLTSAEATLGIVELPIVGELVFDDKADVLDAKEAYDALTPEAKANVPANIVTKLEEAIVEINDIEAAKDTSDMIAALPDVSKITRDDLEDVIASRQSFTDLSEYQQGKVSDETLNKLEQIEEIYVSMDKIDSIGTVTYTNDSKVLIDDAKEYYDFLNNDQKAAIDNSGALNKAFTDYYAVDNTVNKADSINDIRHDSRSDSAIKAARNEYESLSEDQKNLLPEESLQKIVDAETVYNALEKIYAIGNTEYTEESEESVAEARKSYDELTPEQKVLLNDKDLEVLKDAENSYANQVDSANVTYTVFMIIVLIFLVLGAIFLALMILSHLKIKKGVKTMSLAFSPLILASHYLDSRFVVLYILAGLLIIVLVAILVIAIKNPKAIKNIPNVFKDIKNIFKKEPKPEMVMAAEATPAVESIPEPIQEVVSEPIPEPISQEETEEAIQEAEDTVIDVNVEDEEETVTVTDNEGNTFQIRFNKSFTAKLIQTNDDSKNYYEVLKNYVLSYKKTTSRVSWNYDSINSGRIPVLKFAMRGKTLGVYLPLNAEDFADSKYKVEKVETKKFADVPCLYRIKNDRRLEYAKELIDIVMANLGLVKGEEKHESYYLNYEENEPLIARGLIKELKVNTNKSVVKEDEVISDDTNVEEDEVVTKEDINGNVFKIRYVKSFTAKLSQADQPLKDYYNELKNYALSYNNTNSRVSWHFDSINIGRKQILKFSIRGKVLCLYYALDVDDYANSKYKVEKVESKKYKEVPCLYRIKNNRRFDYAKNLIDIVMGNVPTEKGKESNEEFRIPNETTEELLEKGFIKEVKILSKE